MMHRIVLFANDSSPIDIVALRKGVGQEVEFVNAPPDCLRKPLDRLSEECLCRAVRDADAIIFRVGQVTRSVIEAAPQLKIIAVHGVGTDSVDLETASRRRIHVTITPGANANAVAEYVYCVLLLGVRRIHESMNLFRNTGWTSARVPGRELSGKTLGIVGFGAIGSRVASMGSAQGMGIKILVHDPYKKPIEGFSFVELIELLQKSDFVSLHCPLNSQTHHLIGEEELRLMKPSAYLINTARGGVIDEDALVYALDNGVIAGAFLDVFSDEPAPSTHPLVSHPKVFATPHLAGSTIESLERTALMAGKDIRRVLDNKLPIHSVNVF